MARPITIPNVFQNQTGNIPLSQLDTDFSTLATAINDPASYSNYAVDSGAVNAYIITLNPAPSTLASMVGVTITFKPLVTNTGASTINVNGFGAINIVNTDSSALISGEIVAGNIFQLSYNGTNFILMSVSTNLANLANVTGVLTESHGGTGTTTGYYGFKNRIINGAMAIWQRGTTLSTNNNIGYYIDRMWGFSAASTVATFTQISSTGLAGFPYATRAQRTAANTGTGGLYCGQIIESNNLQDLQGQSVTISFWARAGANYSATSNNLIIYLRTGTVADQGSAALISGWTGAIDQISTITLTTSWQKFSATFTVASNAQEISPFLFGTTTGTAGANDYYDVTGFQLEKGSTATSFDYRPYGTELSLCQRYYWQISSNGNTFHRFGFGTAISTTVGQILFNNPVQMRNSALTFSYGGTLGLYDGVTVTTITALSLDVSNIIISDVNATVASGLTQFRPCELLANNSSTAFISISAEL